MKKFILFVGSLVLLLVVIGSIGPLILLAISVFLLYLVFKKFQSSETLAGKIVWLIVGLVILTVGIANIYAVLGIIAAYGLYLIYKHVKAKDSNQNFNGSHQNDPFTNFENEWANLNR